MIAVQINTYWNVEVLYQFLNGVASVIADPSFKSAAKMMFTLGLLFSVIQWVNAKTLEWLSNFLISYVVFILMTVTQSSVIINDITGQEPPKSVSNVPTVLAWSAKITNATSGWLTQKYETVFSIPSDLTLANGDLAFAHRILRQVGKAQVLNPGMRADLTQFIKECTLNDVRDGAIAASALTSGVNTWTTIFSNTSPARFVTYDTLTGTPITTTCTDAALILDTRVNGSISAAEQYYGRQMFPRASSDLIAQGFYQSTLATSYNYILALSATSSDIVKQGMFNTMWQQAGQELPAILNDPAKVAELNALAGASVAAQSANGSHASVAILAQETLPHVRNWIEAFVIGIFPLVVLLMIIASNTTRIAIFKGYLMAFVWIGIWPVMFAMLNHLSMIMAIKKAAALKLATVGGVPFQLTDVFDATLLDEQTMIGYGVCMVPFLAGAVVKIASGQIMQFTDKMMSATLSSGQSAGGEIAKGNINTGNASLDNVAINNTSMNKYNSTMSMEGGGFIMQGANGASYDVAPNQMTAIQQKMNSFAAGKLDRSRTQSAGTSRTGDVGMSASQSDYVRGGSDWSSSLSVGKSTSRNREAYQSTGVDGGLTINGTSSRGQGLKAGRSWSDGVEAGAVSSDSARIEASASAGLSTGGGGTGPTVASAKGGRSGRNPRGERTHAQEEADLVSKMQSQNASSDQISQAVGNLRSTRAPAAGQKKSLLSMLSPINAGASLRGTELTGSERSQSAKLSEGIDGGTNKHQEYSYTVAGGIQTSDSNGQRSSQGNSESKHAAFTRGRTSGWGQEVNTTDSSAYRETASQEQRTALLIQRNLSSDPYWTAQVARHHGISTVRFANRSQDQMWDMMVAYAEHQEIASKSMPQQLPTGMSAPQSKADIATFGRAGKETIAINPEAVVKQNFADVQSTGFKGATAVVLKNLPEAMGLIEASKHAATAGPDIPRTSPSSIPHQSTLRVAVEPDKKIGEGKSPMERTQSQALNRGKTELKKAIEPTVKEIQAIGEAAVAAKDAVIAAPGKVKEDFRKNWKPGRTASELRRDQRNNTE